MDYKIQQDNKRLERKEAKLDKLDKEIAVKQKAKATIDEINAMGKSNLFGGVSLTEAEAEKLKILAKKFVTTENKIADERRKRKAAESERDKAIAELAEEKKKRAPMTEHLQWFGKFMEAMKRSPKRLKAVIEDIMCQAPEIAELELIRQKSQNIEK